MILMIIVIIIIIVIYNYFWSLDACKQLYSFCTAVFQNVSAAIFLPHCATRSDKGNRKTSARRQSLVLSVRYSVYGKKG